MKESRHNLGRHEFAQWTRLNGQALEQFIFTNMPLEAEQAIDDRVITPTINEAIRLAGIEIEGLPPLSVDELIGPTKVGELDPQHQAFYFTGPEHPILQKARKLPTFVTYKNMLDVYGGLGIRRDAVTKNFAGLARNIFEDESIATFGEPDNYDFSGNDGHRIPKLHRFAIRRQMALLAMTGEYRVGISGTQNTNIFNGYGRALVRALYDPGESRQRMDLTMELESLADLVPEDEAANRFKWGHMYHDSEGIGYTIHTYDYSSGIHSYVMGLLEEIGAADPERWTTNISEQAFVLAVEALCPLDKRHKKTIKNGDSCTAGIHNSKLTTRAVQRAKAIAACIAGSNDRQDLGNDVEELDLDDVQEHSGTRSKAAVTAKDFEW